MWKCGCVCVCVDVCVCVCGCDCPCVCLSVFVSVCTFVYLQKNLCVTQIFCECAYVFMTRPILFYNIQLM